MHIYTFMQVSNCIKIPGNPSCHTFHASRGQFINKIVIAKKNYIWNQFEFIEKCKKTRTKKFVQCLTGFSFQ